MKSNRKSETFKCQPVENTRRKSQTNLIYYYFNFTYYLGFTSFRFVFERNGQGFLKHEWKPQKIFSRILSVLCFLRIIAETRLRMLLDTAAQAQNPVLYFRIILGVCSFAYKFLILKRFWMNEKEQLNVIRFLQTSNLPNSNLKILQSRYIVCVLALSVTLCCTDLLVGRYFVVPTRRWTPEWWFRQLVSVARYSFCVGNEPQISVAPELSDISLMDIFLALLGAFGMLERYINGIFSDLFLLTYSITLWSTCYTLSEIIKSDMSKRMNAVGIIPSQDVVNVLYLQHPDIKVNAHRLSWIAIYNQYKFIRELSSKINIAIGGLISCFMAEAIIYYSLNLDETLVTKDLYKKAHMIYFYVCTFSTLFMSADICTQIESVKTWLTDDENRRNVPWDEMQIVLHEIAEKDIGIKGSNVFTITYSVVSNFCSLIVTFFIICVQHSNSLEQTIMDGDEAFF